MCVFIRMNAGVFMRQMADEGESADVVFMDPPRSGSMRSSCHRL